MSYLSTLKITNRVVPAARPRRQVSTREYRRAKLIANIEEQIELVQLAVDKKPLRLKRKRGREVVEVYPRIWWKTDPDGQVYTQIRYNKVALNLGGRGTAIEAGPLTELTKIYGTVIKAVEAGELDAAIEKAARTSPR